MKRESKTETDWQRATDLMNQHRKRYGEARRVIEDLKQRSMQLPSDHMMVKIDGMDNQVIIICQLTTEEWSSGLLYCQSSSPS